MPDVAAGRQRAVAHVGHVAQEHRLAVAHADHQLGDLAGLAQERARSRSPPRGCRAISSPTGRPRLADCSACAGRPRVTPHAAMRAGSISTTTARPGPPMVVTSRVPATRFRSASMLCATRSRSKAPVSGSSLYSVSATIGTSSMPLGLMIGAQHAQAGRQPVGVGIDGVVQPHQRLGARHADLVLHGDDRHAPGGTPTSHARRPRSGPAPARPGRPPSARHRAPTPRETGSARWPSSR